MEGQLAAPFHFAVEFLVLVVAVGAALDAARARRHGAGLWALVQSAGFATIAAAQVVHGSLLARADAGPYVLGLRATGFVLLAISGRPAAAVGPRPAASLAAGAAPAFFFPGPLAEWAVLPAVAAIAVAARGARAHRADLDPATFAFAAAFVSLGIAEGVTALSPPSGGSTLVIAHAVRAAGGLFLGRWLWSSIVRSVRMRFVAAFVVVLTLVVLVVSAALNLVIGDTLAEEELKRLEAAGEARVDALEDIEDVAVEAVRSLAASQVGRSVAEDHSRLPSLVRLGLVPSGSDFVLLVDRRRRVLNSSVNDPERPVRLPRTQEISLAGTRVVDEARDERESAGPVTFAFGQSSGNVVRQLVVLGAAPIEGSKVVLAIGFRMDDAYLRIAELAVEADIALVIGDRVAAATFGPEVDVEGAFRPLAGVLRRAAQDNRPLGATVRVAGTEHLAALIPVTTRDGEPIAVMALARPTSDALAAAQVRITRTLFLITLAAVAIATVLAWLSGGRVTRPIRGLTAAARELRGGNLEARARVTAVDEVGTLGTAFNEMAQELQRTTGDLRATVEQEATLRARLEAVLQSMGDGLIATDPEGTIVTFNREAERVFGSRADAVVGERIEAVMDGATPDGRSLAEIALAGGIAEGTIRRARARPVPVAITSAPLLDSRGEPVGRVVVVRDVSREHEAERMKSEFLQNVSHELRTPITPIKGYAEIMRRKKFPREKAEQFLEGILESTERLERIVEILVDFAAIEAGRLKPRAEPVPVKPFLDGITSRWRSRNGAHRFVRRGGIGLPPMLGDERLLERSLDELLDNAVKFSPDGGQIEVLAEGVANGRARRPSTIRITVRDRGIGIEAERLPDLFQDFRQLDGSETRSFGGLGLGLAYVKRIAAVHGGDVTVESVPGKGSAFSLVLPVADGKGKGQVRAAAPRRRNVSRTSRTPKTRARGRSR